MKDYPFNVFVDVGTLQAAREGVYNPCYRLLRTETGTVDGKGGWQCSHFYTLAPSRLTNFNTSPTDNPSTRVVLECSQEPIALDGTHQSEIKFDVKPEELNGQHMPMLCRIEVSGYQIRRNNPNPIRVILLDSEGQPEGQQWAAAIEFPHAVFGQRLHDKVWLETYYDFKVGVSP